jgi:TetR/AcrR family transcriptional regulator, cholesterol catabolism regulator
MRSRNRISKAQIIDTARRLFRAQGYPGTTLDQVAAELGVTRAALYHWVPSKETLLCEIHEQALNVLLEGFDEIRSRGLEDIDLLRAAIRHHALVLAGNLDAIAVFFQDEASLPEGLARVISARKREYDHMLEAAVRSAQRDGRMRRDVNPKIVVNTVLGMCNWLYQWYDPAGPVSPEELADQVVDIAFCGLMAPDTHVLGNRKPSRRATASRASFEPAKTKRNRRPAVGDSC